MAADWEAITRAEERLTAHSEQRRSQLERRDRRRRVLPWLLAPLVLPAVGAAVLLAVIENAGGDLREWPVGRAAAVVAAAFVLPAALSAWFARRNGAVEAIAWAVVCLCAEVALVFGLGFGVLGLGPD
jgi:uncharacterized membrane protein YhhN